MLLKGEQFAWRPDSTNALLPLRLPSLSPSLGEATGKSSRPEPQDKRQAGQREIQAGFDEP